MNHPIHQRLRLRRGDRPGSSPAGPLDAEYPQVETAPTGIVIDITDAQGERLFKEVTREEVETAVARGRAEAVAPIVIPGPASPAP